ncbi:MAG: arginine--tRNA ligase [Pirellulaceae bacterium]|nr:MAG: arginine--tRNA ligase [Pirellulaceae bacterium]
MNVLGELRRRFAEALRALVDDPKPMLAQVLPTQDERFGDYQANFAMALARPLRKPPRQIAEHVVSALDVDDLCEPPEIAGPGFINLKLRREWLAEQLRRMAADPRLGISPVSQPRTVVIDYSSPNVAKPMHVGHIRSTVIGDALYRTMRFLGHRVLSDNHLGDWGTQFGMILYGYKHFRDEENYRRQPVAELSRLYKLMHQLVDYHEAMRSLEQLEQRRQTSSDPAAFQEQLQELQRRVARVAEDPQLLSLARQHPQIATAVLEETAKLHAGDPENRKLWSEFMPLCLEEINRIYQRLGITFDMQLGESFYQPMLADVVRELQGKGLARISDGAVCVFLEGFDTPMIVQKSDGAYLYATTDLATLKYRMEHFHPDAILYVVDARQSDHFAKLFATARLWGYRDVELQHISFGTVLGEDGRPYKTREGDTVALEELLDEAVAHALRVVCQVDDAKPEGRELSDDERRRVAWVVGHAAVKYRDLSHNRTSDYVFSFEKMLALDGNTAAYLLYAYARVNNIFAKGGIDPEEVRRQPAAPQLPTAEERALAVSLVRFHETLEDVLVDYRPNILTNYLYDVAQRFSRFYTNPQCRVLQAETDALRRERLTLCDLTGRTLKVGLACLGIEVVPKM